MNLTDEEIRIKVAEAMGTMHWSYALPNKAVHCDVPNYPLDLNACASFEATLTREEWFHYNCFLFKELVPFEEGDCWDADNARHCIHATARQRCIAYLRVKGILP